MQGLGSAIGVAVGGGSAVTQTPDYYPPSPYGESNRDPNIKALKRRGVINQWSTLVCAFLSGYKSKKAQASFCYGFKGTCL